MSQSPFETVPAWLGEPYRLFFPLGAALAFAGVVPWVLTSLGIFGYLPVPHAVTEIQGFLTAFALGFLFTFLPRRLGGLPPRAWEAGPALVGVVSVPLLAWAGQEALAHIAWALTLGVLAVFAVPRIRFAKRHGFLPTALLWIPVSLGSGVVGALLAAAFGAGRHPALAKMGADLVWQGVFGGLILGIGVLLLPVLTRNARWPSDGGPRGQRWAHALCGLFWFASFPLSLWLPPSLTFTLRGASALVLLIAVGGIWHVPTAQGLHRYWAWVSTWLFPLGLLLAGLFPAQQVAMLHLTFVGGFALLTLAVGNHVLVAHSGQMPLLTSSPWRLGLFGGALGLAALTRMVALLWPAQYLALLGVAAGLFLVGVGSWGAWIFARMRNKPVPGALPVRS